MTQALCPDEGVFVDLAAGRLADAEVAMLELHLDRCPLCTELLAFLPSHQTSCTALGSHSELATSRTACGDVTTSLILSAVHLVWFAVVIRLAIRSAEYCDPAGYWSLMLSYFLGLGVVGWLVCLNAAFAITKQKRIASGLITLQGCISIMTLTLAPLGLVILMTCMKNKRTRSRRAV